MDTELSYKFEIGRLEVDRAFIVQSRVETAVIESINVLKDVLSSVEAGRVLLMGYQFLLQAAKETFNRSVIPAVSFAAHTATHALFGQQRLKISAGILRPTIRMKDNT